MKQSRKLWLVIGLGVGGVLLLVLLSQRLNVGYRTPLTDCVVDNGTGGGLGLSRWMQRLGIPVQALEVPLWEAPESLPQPRGNCLFTAGNGPWSPREEDLSADNWRSLQQWVSRGNTLIVVTEEPGKLPKAFREALIGSAGKTGAEEDQELILWSRSVEVDPPTEEVAVTTGGHLTVAAQGARLKSVVGPKYQQLAGDERGGILFRFPLGEGAIYLLLDGFAWTNAGLDQGENALVLAGILRGAARGGMVGMDEYRHGHGRAESFLTYLLALPGASVALAIASLWGLFFLYGRNVRFLPVERFASVERRTAREYIDAVAQLHERARAAPLVVEAVARRCRQLSRRSAELPATAEPLLQRAESYSGLDDRPAIPLKARSLVNELIRFRKTVYGSRTIS